VRAAAYVVMIGLVASAVAMGEIGLALAAGGAKMLIVGLEFMELRHAARPHRVGFVLGTLAITGLLVALT
jgi:hypothetical protein